MIPVPAKRGIFISHIAEESPIAILLQSNIKRAFVAAQRSLYQRTSEA